MLSLFITRYFAIFLGGRDIGFKIITVAGAIYLLENHKEKGIGYPLSLLV